MEHYQVAVIGGGPGGYEASIRLNQYQVNTICFEKTRLGGVCLNVGCIPTKALVKVADAFHEMKHCSELGISADNITLEFEKVYQRKAAVVEKLVSGIEFIFKKRAIPVVKQEVTKIKKEKNLYFIFCGSELICSADHVILATGSIPKALPFLPFDGKRILSSDHILSLTEQPKSLAVIGGGVIGCEFASIFSSFGTQVEIIEFLPEIVANEDEEVSKRLAMALKKAGIKIHTKTGVEKGEIKENGVELSLSNGKTILVDQVLVSVGRQPVCDIEFENCEITRQNGFVQIDEACETNEKNIYCIGDVTGKLQLAHTASKQGLRVAELLNAKIKESAIHQEILEYINIPRCTFTNPEIGSCGYTEKQAQEKFGEILVGKFPFAANGKSLGMGNQFGFVKTIADRLSGKIIGMHIIGPNATEMIAQGSILINTQATAEVIEKVVFAHPTLSECVMESIEDLHKMAIHTV